MTKFNIPKSAFPNTLTALNLFCGFLSIVYASNLELKMAAIFIIAASIFDTLDGLAARMVNVASRFGVELDSLADVVSFGAAPSFLMYKAYLYQFGWIGIVIAALPAVLGAFRLARFNVMLTDIKTKGDFTGLPIPLQAITHSFFIISFYKEGSIASPINNFVIPVIILLSLLMVSKIRYNALPKIKDKNLIERLAYLLILIAALILAYLTDGIILFYIFMALILFGIFRHIFVKFFATN